MTEVWLAPNRRVLLAAVVQVAAIVLVGGLLAWRSQNQLIQVVSYLLIALGTVLLVLLGLQLRRPRIAYRDGSVLFNLRSGAPIAVPADIVEAFFLGQGPAHIPQLTDKGAESVNLIARLSQKAPEWAKVQVKPALGHWCEGYVTIRGAWCEPLNGDVIRRLNRRLREVHESTGVRAAPHEEVGKAVR